MPLYRQILRARGVENMVRATRERMIMYTLASMSMASRSFTE